MKNKQKFQRSTLVKLKGQPSSPSMTITKIIRNESENEKGEIERTFSYQCSYWNDKNKHFHHEIFDEDVIEKAKDEPKT